MPRKKLKNFNLSGYISENTVSKEVLNMVEEYERTKGINHLLREALKIYYKYQNGELFLERLEELFDKGLITTTKKTKSNNEDFFNLNMLDSAREDFKDN